MTAMVTLLASTIAASGNGSGGLENMNLIISGLVLVVILKFSVSLLMEFLVSLMEFLVSLLMREPQAPNRNNAIVRTGSLNAVESNQTSRRRDIGTRAEARLVKARGGHSGNPGASIDRAHIASAAAALAAMRSERPTQLDDAIAVRGWLLDHGVSARPLVRVIEESVRMRLVPVLSRVPADPVAVAQARRALLYEGYVEAAVDAALAAWSGSKPVNARAAAGSAPGATPGAPS